MGLEMVRIGGNQKNLYVEMNEVTRVSSRPYKILSDPNGIIWIKYNPSRANIFLQALYTKVNLMKRFKDKCFNWSLRARVI